jgi:hypothetical protein
MANQLQRSWFNVTAIVVGSFGPVFFLAAAGVAAPAQWTLDLLSWPLDGNMRFDAAATRFLSALTGGFLLGWGVTIWLVGRHLYPVAPEAARKAVVYGLLAWFLLDSAGSIASGNASNLLFNLLVLAIAVGPLWRPARSPAA